MFAIGAALYGLVASGIGLFNESILAERGFGPNVYYQTLVVTALTALAGNFGGGWLAMRMSLPTLLSISLFVLALGLAALPHVTTIVHVMLWATAMGLGGGLVMVLFFSVWPRVYGRKHLGSIQGAAQAMTVRRLGGWSAAARLVHRADGQLRGDVQHPRRRDRPDGVLRPDDAAADASASTSSTAHQITDHRRGASLDILVEHVIGSTCMSSERVELLQGTLDLIILRALSTMGAQHAYGLAARLAQVSDHPLSLNQGTLYPALVRLEQKGWIKGAWGQTETHREAKFYNITKSGEKALREGDGEVAPSRRPRRQAAARDRSHGRHCDGSLLRLACDDPPDRAEDELAREVESHLALLEERFRNEGLSA